MDQDWIQSLILLATGLINGALIVIADLVVEANFQFGGRLLDKCVLDRPPGGVPPGGRFRLDSDGFVNRDARHDMGDPVAALDSLV